MKSKMESYNDVVEPESRPEEDCEDADGRFIIRHRLYCGHCGTAISSRDICCEWCGKQILWDGSYL